jgi:hypothetical protein
MFYSKRKCGKLGIELQHQRNNLDIPVDYNRRKFQGFQSKLDSQFLVLRGWQNSLPPGLSCLLVQIRSYLNLLKMMILLSCYLLDRMWVDQYRLS